MTDDLDATSVRDRSKVDTAQPASRPSAATTAHVTTDGFPLTDDAPDERADHLDEVREPGDAKYVIVETADIGGYLDRKSNLLDADAVDYVKLHLGNLAERLRLHTGDYDVPCGRRDPVTDCGDETPFEVNLEEYRRRLRAGRTLYQVVYYDWTRAGEEQPPSAQDAQTVEEKPDGWISVSRVCELKDQGQSSVTRAIRHGHLTMRMRTSPKKRFVRPDKALTTWTSGRQGNFLLRRRLKVLRDVMIDQLHRPRQERSLTLAGIMRETKREDIRRHGTSHIPDGSYQHFFRQHLPDAPSSAREWAKRIGQIVDRECRS